MTHPGSERDMDAGTVCSGVMVRRTVIDPQRPEARLNCFLSVFHLFRPCGSGANGSEWAWEVVLAGLHLRCKRPGSAANGLMCSPFCLRPPPAPLWCPGDLRNEGRVCFYVPACRK